MTLEVLDIHTYYGESYVLRGVSLRVSDSSVVALLGRNGMGKTTTIRSIIGLTPPRQGKVFYREKEMTALPPEKIAKLGIGLVPQGRYIFPSLSVTENLTMAARGAGKADSWSLDEVYSLFPILKERSSCRGTLLSGGEQQMLAIGRALMTNPELLLLDEPSEGLAPLIVKEVGKIIYQLKQRGFSILLVEQNLPMALKVADYLYILSNGRIVYDSPPEQLRSNDEIKAKYIGVAG
ncbi:MAG TPA: ABC transporter ATP-binding protein [Thermodesulfobacteriota bacterium]|nr:ABC transporter ATP-binding protein [Thermodesulfobacteriota bacterium]